MQAFTATDSLGSGQVGQVLADDPFVALGSQAVLPSNRLVPQRLQVPTDFPADRLG